MGITVSIPPGLAHVSDEAMVNRPPAGMDILDVIYHTVHGFPGGTAVLAQRMGMSLDVLRQKANVNNPQHVFHPRQLLDLMYFSGNDAILHAMADHMGRVVVNATPDQSGGDMLEASMRVQVAFADLMRAVADPLARMAGQPGQAVTGNEMRRAEECAQEHQAAMAHMLGTMRAHMRKAPGGDQ
nr:phage regulatory CII family protein [uncultured Acidovorax sp.]